MQPQPQDQRGEKRPREQGQGNLPQAKKRREDPGQPPAPAPAPPPPAQGAGGLQLVVGQQYRFVQFVADHNEGTVEFTDHTGQLAQLNGTMCTFPTHAGIPAVNVLSLVPQLTWPALQPQLAPITCMIIGAGRQHGLVAKAAAYGIDFNQLLSMIIELDLTQNADDAELYESIVQGSLDSLTPGGHTPSCYNAANVIYNLLAANPLPVLPSGTPASISKAASAAGFQGREKPAEDDPHFTQNLTNACDGLCTALTIASNSGLDWVFGVNFGIHGFVIAVSGQTAELLQSFAGEDGEMLMGFLEKTLTHGRVYTVVRLVALLHEMVVEGVQDSTPGALRAQCVFFGGRADDPSDEGLPMAPLRWVSSQQKANAVISQALTAWILDGIKFYDDVKAAKDPT